ncbi:hypothetical protein ACFC1R_19160 [Kitasatospora sp. NPDC056138]|uniref:hypothetical protein n=1 Tax=Kitasatospora sp. NPDC056138 TaxID=3345724 RepID=UPI0035E2A79D
MPTDQVTQFLEALSPESREQVRQQPREQLEKLTAAWRTELVEDIDLDSLDELSPPAAAEEAAERVVRAFLAG